MSCFLPPTHPRVLKLTEDGAVVVGLSGGVSVLTVPLQVLGSNCDVFKLRCNTSRTGGWGWLNEEMEGE